MAAGRFLPGYRPALAEAIAGMRLSRPHGDWLRDQLRVSIHAAAAAPSLA